MRAYDRAMEAKILPGVDVLIAGGGPAGLSAALVLGRACKTVSLCDAGERRNAKAEHVHGFVTRDGIPPAEFRSIARAQLEPYGVSMRAEAVTAISGSAGDFVVTFGDGSSVGARRVLLALGVRDEPLDLPGMREAWGRSVFQCPHCHGWERKNKRWGIIMTNPAMLDHAPMFTGWTPHVTVFTHGTIDVPAETRRRFEEAGMKLKTQAIERLVLDPRGELQGLALENDEVVPLDAIFTMPKQHLPPLVTALELAITELGYVQVSMFQETSRPGLYAAGDLTSPGQAAILAAAAGAMAGFSLVRDLSMKTADHAA